MDDQVLITLLERAKLADKHAFQELYEQLYPRLLRFLVKSTGSVEDAEDLLNEVMLAVWRGAVNFRGDSQVFTWVIGIARIMAKRWYLRHKSRHNQEDRLEDISILADDISGWQDSESLAMGISRLPEEQQEALKLAYYYGYTCEEIAELTQCPAGTVKTRLFHARQKLRQLFLPQTLH